jgi:hypothetical protein
MLDDGVVVGWIAPSLAGPLLLHDAWSYDPRLHMHMHEAAPRVVTNLQPPRDIVLLQCVELLLRGSTRVRLLWLA